LPVASMTPLSADEGSGCMPEASTVARAFVSVS
jgi:hypothetical protein